MIPELYWPNGLVLTRLSRNAGTIPWIAICTDLGDGMATIAIIGALEKEVAQIKEELSGVHESQEAGLTVVNGGLSGLTVVATTAGMGDRKSVV